MAHTITALGSPVEWQTTAGDRVNAVQMDSSHWLVVYHITIADLMAVVFTVDGSGVPSMVGTPFEFASPTGLADPSTELAMYDSDTAVLCYKGQDADGFVQAVAINTSTWAVTSAGSATEIELADFVNSSIVKVPGEDAFVVAARGTSNDGFSYSVTFNPGTGALTLVDTFEFDTQNCFRPVILNINGDATKFLVLYEGSAGDGFAQVLSLNTSTWDLTTQTTTEWETNEARFIDAVQLDVNHYLVVWSDITAAISEAQVMTVNLSTWAVTMEGSPVTIPGVVFSATGDKPSNLALLDHPTGYYRVARAYRALASNRATLGCLTVDDSTWAVTADATDVDVDTIGGNHPRVVRVSATRALVFYTETSTSDGFARTLDVVPDGGSSSGSGSGSTVRSGTAAGSIDHSGTGAGATARAGTASGTTPEVGVNSGSGSGATTRGGSASGSADKSGTGAGATTRAGAAVGSTVRSGSGSGSTARSGSATGSTDKAGFGSGSTVRSGSAFGTTPAEGVNNGSGSGHTVRSGTGSGSKAVGGVGAGLRVYLGVSSGSKVTEGHGEGTTARTGTATGSVPSIGGHSGVGSGHTVRSGTATGTFPARGSGSGHTVRQGFSTLPDPSPDRIWLVAANGRVYPVDSVRSFEVVGARLWEVD